ncbi:MAG: LamG-like jellyroll fold domain-containing protein, partial [Lentimicrobiaceae bacterium]
ISSVKTYALTGHNLSPASGNITLTAPDNFQISLSESSGFVASLSIPYSGHKLSTTIYVRFLPTSNNTEYSGIITHAGGDADNVSITVSGSSILEYCQPEYTYGTSDNDYISLVQLDYIYNLTGASSSPYYYYYENLSTDLIGNSIYEIVLRAGTYYRSNNIAVWIDYNQNGTFETNEKLGQVTLDIFTYQGTIQFTIPSDAVSGTTRMRVREVWDQSNIDPCSTYSYGETEDYNVNIITSIQVNVSTSSTCPGAQNGTITVNATGGQEPYQYSLNSGVYQLNNVFTNLAAGYYSVSVKDVNNEIATTTALIGTSDTLTMPPLTATIIPSSCANSLDGAIAVTNIPVSIDFLKADADYVNLGGSLLNNLRQFTIEGWIKLDKSQISGTRTWGLFGQNDAIEFGIMNSTTLQLWSNGGGTLNIPLSLYPDDNDWHHIAGTGDGSIMKVYIDGELSGSLSGSTTNYGSSTYPTVIGGHVWDETGNYFSGSIIKTSYWSRALSVSEIAALANTKFTQYTGDESGLIAGYNFFEGGGTTLSKIGSATTNGTLMNTPEWNEVFSFVWTKTNDPSFSSNTKNISLISSGEYTLNALYTDYCPITGTWTVGYGSANFWTGLTDNNWNDSGNWTCDIPDLATDANIPSGKAIYPLLGSGEAGACNNLVIDPGASVTVMDNTLQIAGIIQNTGTFDAAQGTIEMKGAFAQSIPAGTFNNNLLLNLTINNPAHVTLNGTLLISGVLKAQSGNLITGGYLTLLSTASQTALIDGSGQGEVLGNVTMQRYLPSAYGYKYFGSPFQSATVNEFADDIDLNASFSTSYYYDENAPTTGWVAYTNTSSSLVPGIGYALNFGTGTTPVTVNTSGVINNGTIGPITLYNHNQPFTKGFNLVSNPYPSPIDWDATGWTKQNIDDALYFFDAGTTDQYQGTYNTYIKGISTNGQASNIIGAQQGFFVHVSDGSYPIQGALTFINNVRVNNLNPAFHKNISVGPSSIIRISAGFENARPDYLVVYFNDDSQTGFVATYDALKLKNTATDVPNIYSVSSDGRELSIDALPFPTEDTHVVNLGISSITKGTLIITLADLVNLPAGYGLYLKDNYSGKIQDLQSTPEFRFDINNETYTDRFTLLISKSVLTQEAVGTKSYDAYTRDGSVYLYLKLKEEQVVVKVTDMTGKLVLETTVYGEGHH